MKQGKQKTTIQGAYRWGISVNGTCQWYFYSVLQFTEKTKKPLSF